MRCAFLLVLCIAGCAQFPELESALAPEAVAAPYPTPQPLAPILAQVEEGTARSDEIEAQTNAQIARADALRAR